MCWQNIAIALCLMCLSFSKKVLFHWHFSFNMYNLTELYRWCTLKYTDSPCGTGMKLLLLDHHKNTQILKPYGRGSETISTIFLKSKKKMRDCLCLILCDRMQYVLRPQMRECA